MLFVVFLSDACCLSPPPLESAVFYVLMCYECGRFPPGKVCRKVAIKCSKMSRESQVWVFREWNQALVSQAVVASLHIWLSVYVVTATKTDDEKMTMPRVKLPFQSISRWLQRFSFRLAKVTLGQPLDSQSNCISVRGRDGMFAQSSAKRQSGDR